MKTISLPVYRRPDTLKKALDAIRSNKTEGYTLYVSAEPGPPEVLDLIKKIDWIEVRLRQNALQRGLNDNICSTIQWAFEEGSEFNITVEDDVVLAPDALDLAEWFRKLPERGEYVSLGFCAYVSRPK